MIGHSIDCVNGLAHVICIYISIALIHNYKATAIFIKIRIVSSSLYLLVPHSRFLSGLPPVSVNSVTFTHSLKEG
jgi:hypothetical protein